MITQAQRDDIGAVSIAPEQSTASRQRWRLDGAFWRLHPDGGGAACRATVPGNIASDLIAAGQCPAWQHDANFRAFHDVAEKTWTYSLAFSLNTGAVAVAAANTKNATASIQNTPDRIRIIFEGIDTFAEVRLDGMLLGRVKNMFRRHVFALPKNFDAASQHELTVRIDPVQASARRWADDMGVDLTQLPAAFNTHERTAARKMQMVFGWDNTPRILTGGIHGHVFIEALGGPVIDRLAWVTESIDVARQRARVCFLVELDLHGRTAADLRLRIEGRPNAHGPEARFAHLHPVAGPRCECRFEIEDARLWWPNGMGEPHLYATTVTLCDGEVPLDCRELLAGLRTVALDTSSQGEIDVDYDLPSRHAEVMDGGLLGAWQRMPKPPRKVGTRHFRLLINGVAVFVRGANWQTADVFPAAVTDARRRALLAAAAGAHMNMLRLWGGGAPEPDSFYDEAARRGLMIWQDFFFACAKYPEAAPFLAELREELDDIVLRLRNHTAIVLWCGDNESDMIDVNRGGDPGANPINKRLIPDALREGDLQGRPYHPSSPSGGPYPRSDWAGDRRDWGAWYPENNYIHIRQDEARFMSEGGCYALPAPATFDKYFAPENRWPPDCEILRLHTGDLDFSVRRFDRLNARAWGQIAPVSNCREAIEVSQFAQAWGCKTLIEHHRMRRAQCGGLLLWKLNDAWPAIDAGLLDYDLRPRLALAFVGEAMKPVALVTGQDMAQPERLRVALVNDTRVAVKGFVTADYLLPGPTGDFAAVRAQEPAWTPAWTSATVEVPANSMLELPALQQPDPQGVWVLKFTDGQGGLRQSTAATRSARTACAWWRQQGASGAF